LSIAGKRGGLSANRSSLFFEAIKIIRDKRPKYFIFENVKGLFSSNGGKDFDIVLRSIADIGYDGQWQLLNTRWFLPQNRERVYFVGHIRGKCRPKIFPIGESDQKIRGISKQRIQKQRLHTNTITARYEGEGAGSYIIESKQKRELNQIGVIGKDSEATRVYDTTCARTIKNGGGMGAKTGLYKTNSSIRRLTPTECERLQGFPDGWTEGQSDTQRYKQLGNAVTVPVVKAIMERLYNAK
jgi:DNA (cytosine-5)-methyltransferase 1